MKLTVKKVLKIGGKTALGISSGGVLLLHVVFVVW